VLARGAESPCSTSSTRPGRVDHRLLVAGGAVIDYDRLVVQQQGVLLRVIDNPTVGKLMANGIIAAMKAKKIYGKHPVVSS
jgi:ABC-type xylose transport system substrate-binding protein